MANGFFITFEGGEGGGKSTQARRLAERIGASGRETVVTREPGGAPGAEEIRNLLVNGATDRWSPLAETLLFSAARDDHLRNTIRPALARGAVVICDRFADSTRAYQGAAGDVPSRIIDALEQTVVGGTKPDLTFILDLAPEAGMARAGSRAAGEDRFERKPVEFHNRLRDAFLAISKAEPARCVVIDAASAMDEVASEIWAVAATRLGLGEDVHG